MRVARSPIIYRLHRRRHAEAGLTLIELLVSLMLLVLITGFLAEGLGVGRRAFTADQDAAVEAANSAALDSLANLIATALPTQAGRGRQIAFEGGGDDHADWPEQRRTAEVHVEACSVSVLVDVLGRRLKREPVGGSSGK